MDMLHRLYSAFDDITARYGLFKVETIGTNQIFRSDRSHLYLSNTACT